MSAVVSSVGSSAPVRLVWTPPTGGKLPQITLLFWVIKVATTGTGEAASDFLAAHNLLVAAAVGTAKTRNGPSTADTPPPPRHER
jgi:hypothetical protein